MKKIPAEVQMGIAMLILFCVSVFLINVSIKEIEEDGGFKRIAIEIGKDFKDVQEEVTDYKPEQVWADV